MPTGCHAKGTLILMHDGSTKTVECVRVNDKLMGPDSQPKSVLSLIKGQQQLYKITPKKSESFVVNADHILCLKSTQEKCKEKSVPGRLTKGKVEYVTVKEYLSKSKWYKHTRKLWKTSVDFSVKPKPTIDPYSMGCLLGDGSLKNAVCLTTMDSEVAHVAYTLAWQFNLSVRKATKLNNLASSYYITKTKSKGKGKTSSIITHLITLGLYGLTSQNKFIPDIYKTGSRETRLSVLAGLIDTDGHLNKNSSNGFDFISKSKRLATDFQFIARSVGLRATLSKCKKTCQNDFEGTYLRVHLSGNCSVIPTRIERKKASNSKQKKDCLVTGFKVTPFYEDNRYYGFNLNGDHLYLTADFTVHHNTGKSLVIAGIICRMMYEYPNTRILMCTHVKELIEQNVKALRSVWATAPVGINSASLKTRDTAHPIIYAGIASIVRKVQDLGRRDIMFIDECHLVGPGENSMYQQVIAKLSEINPLMKVIGLSATPFRMGQGRLIDGDIFDDVCLDLTSLDEFNKFIDDYYMCPLIPKRTEFQYDVSNVPVIAGDFNQRELQVSVDQAILTRQALLEAVELGRDRKKWLVFCSGVDHAEHVAEELNRLSITAEAVTNKTPGEQRDRLLTAHKAGLFKAIVNNAILTTGYDDSGIDLIVDLAHTMSPGRHVQKYGRGTRPVYDPRFTPQQLEDRELRRQAFEQGGKLNCLVLDFAGNTQRLGPINDPVIPLRRGAGTGEVPIKLCEVCGAYNHISARICCDCGEEFVFQVKTRARAGEDEIIKRSENELQVIFEPVLNTTYRIHQKNGKPPSLQCTYFCGARMYRQWVCFQHTGLAKHKAHDWWRQRCPEEPPETVSEAISMVPNLRTPKQLKVLMGGKYPEIQECLF